MKIADLSYIENLSENELIVGGDSPNILGLSTYAYAEGPDGTYTLGAVDNSIKTVGNGKVTKARAKGIALAIGSDTAIANVDYYALGFDKVKVKTKSGQGENYAYEIVSVKAMDVPGK